MHDALGVRGLQSIGNLQSPIEKRPQRNGTLTDALLQRVAFEQLHRNEGPALIFINLINGADVGMVERRGGAGFALETLEGARITDCTVGKEFQSDLTAETNVLRFVNHAHSARTKLLVNAIVRNDLVGHLTQNSGAQLQQDPNRSHGTQVNPEVQ
jgi:hypothetical protein